MAWEKFKYAEQETTLPAKILLIDELASFLDNQPREKMRLVDQFQDRMQNITRLGRAAHVHLIAATQSCTSSLFPPSLKNNIAFRCICGRVEANISRMAIDMDIGESIPKTPGAYLGWLSGDVQMYQGYWTPKDIALNLGTFKEGYELFTDEDGEVHLEVPEVEEDDDDEIPTSPEITDGESEDLNIKVSDDLPFDPDQPTEFTDDTWEAFGKFLEEKTPKEEVDDFFDSLEDSSELFEDKSTESPKLVIKPKSKTSIRIKPKVNNKPKIKLQEKKKTTISYIE